MHVAYSPSLVLLSVAVAIFASYVALNLAYSVTQAQGKARLIWLTCGSLAMGIGIWSMHFVGMLAFEMPGMDMAYDIPLMALSVLVAVMGSALALFVVSRPSVPLLSLIASGIAMATAIAGMHYIGMFSMRMNARIEWDPVLVALSILIALGASFAALMISIRVRNNPENVTLPALASIIMGFAIAGMHYTGMIAATFVHDESAKIEDYNLLVSSGVTVVTVLATTIILGIALASSIAQRIISTRQKRMQERTFAIQKRETQLRTITNAIPTLVAQLDHHERFLFANEAFCDWFNCDTSTIRSLTFRDVLGEDRYPANKIYIDKALAGETVSYERNSRSRDRHRVLNITFMPEFDAQKRVLGFLIVASDVSQYKAIEAELQKAKQLAEVANETKSAFLANMSHEIRTPLGAVIGFSELLVSDEMSEDEKKNAVAIIKRNGKLLSTIINDILDLSKVEAGKLEIESAPVSLRDILAEISTLLKLEADGKGIKFDVVYDGEIPKTVHTDPTRLRQVLFNIIGNAIKFTQRGSVIVTVKIENSKILFTVKDTGTGISQEQAARLFSPFTQADATMTRRFGGTGLGLVLSKKLANALGGDVVLARSELGAGSTFVVSIDPHIAKGETEKPAPKAEAAVPRLAELSKFNILIVDDSLDNLELFKHILTLTGARVDTANNGREGVEKAMRGDFNAILMDLQMPEMDGYEATKELRKQGFKRPIIALTAHAMKEERQRCLDNGFDNHLTKPIDRKSLLNVLSEYSV